MMEVLVIENEKEFKLQLPTYPRVRDTGQTIILSWGMGERQVEVTMPRSLLKNLISDCDNCDHLKNQLENVKQDVQSLEEELRDFVWDRLTLFA